MAVAQANAHVMGTIPGAPCSGCSRRLAEIAFFCQQQRHILSRQYMKAQLLIQGATTFERALYGACRSIGFL
jgi:hypothetical protein